jgi:O-antigen ligase
MGKSERIGSITEWLGLMLMVAAFVVIQVLIGGTRMIFSLPSYTVLGIVGLLALFSLRQPKAKPCDVCIAIATAFFAYILARAWFSPVPYIARSDFYSVLAGLVVYFYTACILTGGKQRVIFLCLLFVLAIGHAIVGAVQFRNGNNFMPISWLQRYDYGHRASGFYVCPNHLAGLLEVLGVLGLSLICWSRVAASGKLLLAYAVAACYLGLVLTASRGGYLSTAVSLVVFALLSLVVLRKAGGRLFWTMSGVGSLAALVLGCAVLWSVKKSSYLTERAQNTFELQNMRFDLWRGALEQWRLEPIFGTGAATYVYYGRLFRSPRVQHDPIYVHNDYLQLLAEYGIVGAAGMALFLAVHLWHGMANFARLGPKRVAVSQRILSNALALNIGALAAVSSYLAHSVVDFNLHIPANLLLMAFVFGLLANEGVIREREPSATLPNHWFWRLALPVMGLALLVQSLRLLPGEYFSERARTAVRDGRGAVAIMYALRGLKYDPQNPDLHFRLGLARRTLGDEMSDPAAMESFYHEAIAALRRAREIAPRDEVYALELASALDVVKRFDEAEWVFYDARQLDPKSESLQRYYEAHLELWRRGGEPQPPLEAGNSES